MHRSSLLCVVLIGALRAQDVSIPLTVDSGVPLRVYLTKRISMRVGEPATAKVIEPVYVFDRMVIPVGAEVMGHVAELDPVSKLTQASSIMSGNFTPLHKARVEFTEVHMPDGSVLPIHTESAIGLPTIYEPPKPAKPGKNGPANPASVNNTAGNSKTPKNKPAGAEPSMKELAAREVKQELNHQINGQLNAHTYGLGSLVRGPNKVERLEDFAWAKSPYRPQRYRRGTRFDVLLMDKLEFGSALVPVDSLRQLGTSATLDRAAQVRFVSSVSSRTAKVGDSVQAILSQPLTDNSGKLVLPEGTQLSGAVRQVRPARWLHRTGRLRFTFDQVTLPPSVASLPEAPPERSEARLEIAETDPADGVKIDSEGAAKATESKTRLLRPLIAGVIAMKALDNDTGKAEAASGKGSDNAAGLALGGFSGFGVLGLVASQFSHIAGSAFGVYGLAISVYTNVVARGPEVEFKDHSSMQIRFGPRPLTDGKR